MSGAKRGTFTLREGSRRFSFAYLRDAVERDQEYRDMAAWLRDKAAMLDQLAEDRGDEE